MSINSLRAFVSDSSQIFAYIGNVTSKLSRILAEAESWYKSHFQLLRRCRIVSDSDSGDDVSSPFVKISELEVAVDDAKSRIAIDIDEALKLKDILEMITNWRSQVAMIAPKRSKRQGRATRSKFSLSYLESLISEAAKLPIDTTEDVNRLQVQLSTVAAWRSHAAADLENIIAGFHQLQSRVVSVYGEPEEFHTTTKESRNNSNGMKTARDNEMHDSGNEDDDDDDDGIFMNGSCSELTVLRQIKELQDSASDICVVTEEGELCDVLESVATWCIRSFKYVNSPRDIFDKRYYGAFDRFLAEGETLCKESGFIKADPPQDYNLSNRMGLAWGVLVSDQLQRLNVLKTERESFKEWCREASTILSDEKKMTAEMLYDLAQRSRNFPASKLYLRVYAPSFSLCATHFLPLPPQLLTWLAGSEDFRGRLLNGLKKSGIY